MPGLAILEAPSGLGLASYGVQQLPSALLQLGLADGLGVRATRRVEAPTAGGEIDPATGVLNAAELASYSIGLADAVQEMLEDGEFPLILGGDCSILLGSALALKRRGRHGLLFIDGNADFFQPEANPNGEAASMDLAFATGHGPAAVADLERRGASICEEDVVAFGWRDHKDQADYGSQPLPAATLSLDLPSIRRLGLDNALDLALARLCDPRLDGFLIHLDADVLDDEVMPAVDYRIPGGLSPDELTHVLTCAVASGRAVGLEVAIYNPQLDPEAAAGAVLTEVLTAALRHF
jgi:arginase